MLHHRRESSNPVAGFGLDDPEVLLYQERARVKDLRQQMSKMDKEFAQKKMEMENELKKLQNEIMAREKHLQHVHVAKENSISNAANEITRLTYVF